MNILRPAYPEDDERIYPAGFFPIPFVQQIPYAMVFGVTQILRVPYNVVQGFEHTIVTNLLEQMILTQDLVYSVEERDRVTFTHGLPYRILEAGSGVTAGDWYFLESHGL